MKLSLPAYSNSLDVTTLLEETDITRQMDSGVSGFTARFEDCCWRSYSSELRAGITLSVIEASFDKPFYLAAEAQDGSVLRFTFCLSGSLQVRFETLSDELVMASGYSYFSALSGALSLASDFAVQQKLLLVRVDIDPLLFTFLFESYFDSLHSGIVNILTGYRQGYRWQSAKIPLAAHIVLSQLLNCPYQGAIKQLYLEGKVLELLALQVNQFTEEDHSTPHSRHLKPDDIDRIHHAKRILTSDLTEPPSIADLARQVSINDFKLKHGFRQVFGTTVFGYLRQHRMEHAQRLLRSQRMNVSQVSQAVGYSNPSQFSAAFKKMFGITPKLYQQKYTC
ncbi:MAG: AraC family transcriptional regulator [Cyanobacteria bacterium P01_H01_bin.15]